MSPKRPKAKPLSREQVWYLIKKLEIWPPECDLFLEAAGLDSDRVRKEELDIQRHFKLRELWVFARVILDPDPEWYGVVSENVLKKRVRYCYFTSSDTTFRFLLNKLENEVGENLEVLRECLECILLPEELFITNFAIYNPGDGDSMYCCGTKPVHGKAERFYTMHSSEGDRLYEFLRNLRTRLNTKLDIYLQDAHYIYPGETRIKFTSTESGPKQDSGG